VRPLRRWKRIDVLLVVGAALFMVGYAAIGLTVALVSEPSPSDDDDALCDGTHPPPVFLEKIQVMGSTYYVKSTTYQDFYVLQQTSRLAPMVAYHFNAKIRHAAGNSAWLYVGRGLDREAYVDVAVDDEIGMRVWHALIRNGTYTCATVAAIGNEYRTAVIYLRPEHHFRP
jgi:hypothetical protein